MKNAVCQPAPRPVRLQPPQTALREARRDAERGGGIIAQQAEILGRTRKILQEIGYADDLLKQDFGFGDGHRVDLVAFCRPPPDIRSSGIAVMLGAGPPLDKVRACSGLAAPVVFVWTPAALEWWKQTTDGPELHDRVRTQSVSNFFRRRKVREELGPDKLYRAKNLGRIDRQYQLSFVDVGLMQLAEQEVGGRVAELVERVVRTLQQELFPGGIPNSQQGRRDGQWLFKAVFWLLAAKILQDKGVDGFKLLDLADAQSTTARNRSASMVVTRPCVPRRRASGTLPTSS